MDVIKNFTKRSMGRNKKRTIVTIIGVMLSAALICTVAGMAATFRDGMVNYYINYYGSFHGKAEDIPVNMIQYITDNAHVERAGVVMPVGTAEFENSTSEHYISVLAFDDVALSDVALTVTEGRLPENDKEIIITKPVMNNFKDNKGLKVGDKVTLELGRREVLGRVIPIDDSYYYPEEVYEEDEMDVEGIVEDGSEQEDSADEQTYDGDLSDEAVDGSVSDGAGDTGTAREEAERAAGESLSKAEPREFTIVGVMESPNNMVQVYGTGGYVCVTGMYHGNETLSDKASEKGDAKSSKLGNPQSLSTMMDNTFSAYRDTPAFYVNIYYTYDKARNYVSYTDDIKDEVEKQIRTEWDKTDHDEMEYYPTVDFQKNDLVTILGGVGDTATAMVEALAGIIIAIIVVTSVFVISNSFRISVAEKKVQLGMLSSVGATKRQIKKIVLKEGFYIWAAGTTLGILLGVVVVAILTVVVQKLLGSFEEFSFRFVFPWWVVVIVICMSAVTIYFACIIPARTAAKQSPIEAIRGNQEIKLKGKKLKTNKLTKKLFGIGGVIAAKNLKRSRRSYRTTVVSIVLGVATFIAMSSFLDYGKKLSEKMYIQRDYDLAVVVDNEDAHSEKSNNNSFKEYEILAGLSGVDKYSIPARIECSVPKELINKDYQFSDDDMEYIDVAVLQEDAYREFLDEAGIEASDMTKVAVLEDDHLTYNSDGSGEVIHTTNIEKGDVIPLTYIYDDRRPDRPHRIDNASAGDGEDSETEQMPKTIQNVTITAKSDVKPTGFTDMFFDHGIIFVCEGFFDKPVWKGEMYLLGLFINTENADELEKLIYETVEADDSLKSVYVYNISEEETQMDNIMLLISIFMYGFIIVIILIGVTNIFNTIYTNMNLRAKEFAMLKSVGMTKREFDHMVRLESIMYGTKSLLTGLPIGLVLSYAIYKAVAKELDFGYYVPVYAIICSVLFVAVVVWLIMYLSLARIRRQNIIETIRKQTY